MENQAFKPENIHQWWRQAAVVLGVVLVVLGLSGYSTRLRGAMFDDTSRAHMVIGAGLIAAALVTRKGNQLGS